MLKAAQTAALLLALVPLGCMGSGDEAQPTEAGTTAQETTTVVQTEQAPPTTTPEDSAEPPVAVKIATLPPDGPQAATSLHAAPHCAGTAPPQPVATLRWNPAAERGTVQRVIVTIYPDGFEQGLFEASPPLASDRSSLTWRRVHGEAIHFWRVLTRHGDEWAASRTRQFQGVACPADYAGP